MFRREVRYLVEKWEDIGELPEGAREDLLKAVAQIETNRARRGKIPYNKYIVVNEDELYSWVVWRLIEISQTNSENLPILLQNLEAELAGY